MATDAFALTKLSVLRNLLKRHGFSLKKQLGQNFLVDSNVLEKIANVVRMADLDGILEIGPGAGVVTRVLASQAQKVVAVEKDESLRPVLSDTLGGCVNVDLRFADFLDVDLKTLWVQEFGSCERVGVVANLPYYITTPILFHVLESPVDLAQIIIMVQKEVADRMVAQPGSKDYGILSLSVQYRARVSKVISVGRGCFFPAPNVDSVVVQLTSYGLDKPVKVANEDHLFRIVKAAFGMRRKTLLNALSGGLSVSKERTQEWLTMVGINPMCRGETLSLQDFASLANAYSTQFD